MQVAFEQRVGYVEIILRGVFGEKDAADVSTRFEAFIAGSPPEDAAWACVLLNLREAQMISRRVFAALVGYATLFRLRGKPTVAAWTPEAVRVFLEETRTAGVIIPARDDTEAYQTMVHSIPREYNADYFAFLVNLQYLTKDQLRSLTVQHKEHGGKVSMERLLVDSKIFSWRTLLAAHVRYRQQKAPSAGHPVADLTTQAAGLFGPAAALPAGKRPDADEVPDPFQQAAAAKASLAEEPAPAESEFVQPRLLGAILVELKILSEAQLREALERQRQEGKRAKLGDLLVRLGMVTDDQLFKALEHQFKRKKPGAGAAAEPRKSEFVARALLGQILLELGLLSEKALRQALDEQRASGTREKLGSVLLRLGLVTRDQIFSALETQASRKAGRDPGLQSGVMKRPQ